MQLPRFGRGVWAPGVFCAAMVLGRTAAAQGDDPPSLEEPSGALTLEQAVALAIERGPELRAAELQLRRRLAQVKLARTVLRTENGPAERGEVRCRCRRARSSRCTTARGS